MSLQNKNERLIFVKPYRIEYYNYVGKNFILFFYEFKNKITVI
jgi:hypothetical protein